MMDYLEEPVSNDDTSSDDPGISIDEYLRLIDADEEDVISMEDFLKLDVEEERNDYHTE